MTFVCVIGITCAAAYARSGLSAHDVTVPSGSTHLLRPGDVFFDPRTQDLYIADTGNNRITIFDKRGNFDFAFADDRHLIAPRMIAVDSVGRIYVLSESQNTALSVFDYDGSYLRDLVLQDSAASQPLSISSFLLDDHDRLLAISCMPARVNVFTTSGSALYSFPIFTELDKATQEQQLLGKASVVNGDLLIPMPVIGQVARYKLDGSFVTAFGVTGGGPGELSVPVSVSSDGRGGILVLDRNRHAVLQYRDDGRFMREFGGMGQGSGWFYLPSTIVSGADGVCYVAQTFMNRVQAVRFDSDNTDQSERVIAVETPDEASSAIAPSH
jgi:DNA-binding beta-propeller fold protein YncE